ncbi:MAG TPA: malate synthase A [Gemmatimonadaceae bacterium]|jgi:malate synthase|nr:malate synthase A [Gemmatimonadaceae bacterium]
MTTTPRAATSEAATVAGARSAASDALLTSDALEFLASLHRAANDRRVELLALRPARRASLASHPVGASIGFPKETAAVRAATWHVAPAPPDLDDRRVEITGPVDRKMMINALNSGASAFMADLEDSCSPTWENVIDGQRNLYEAVRGTLALETGGRQYRLEEKRATLLVRPRGWHLEERHIRVGGQAMSASLVDFGLYMFHNASELLERGSGPYFYLPKLESHLEARLWNDVFIHAQAMLGIPRGTIRATCLIETLPAAFEMDEILYELREHASGLNAGRWDYLFSFIKTFIDRPDMLLPDRAQLTMTVPFMRAYALRLVQICHARGAHAIGGMAAFIPSRKNAEVNARAMTRVREDKERESGDGFDGTWVAHPDLVPLAREVFDAVLGDGPNQKHRLRDDLHIDASQLVDASVPGGLVTEGGIRTNVEVAIRYLDAWLRGSGAVAIHNLMEDAATAEISRMQLTQWIRHGAEVDGAGTMTREFYQRVRGEELVRIEAEGSSGRAAEAAALLDTLVLGEHTDFLTLPGYALLG